MIRQQNTVVTTRSPGGVRKRFQHNGSVVLVTLLVVVALVAIGTGTRFVGPSNSMGLLVGRNATTNDASLAYALMVEDGLGERTFTSEVVAIDESSGDVVARLMTGDHPNVVPDPSRSRVFLLQTKWRSPTDGAHILSAIDTQTWEEIDSTIVPSRIQNTLPGPSSLALTSDGKRLVVYSTNGLGDYWLEAYDASTLDLLSGQAGIALPRGCGGSPMLAVDAAAIAVLCGVTKQGNDDEGLIDTPLALQFVDTNAARVVATIPLFDSGLYVKGKPAGMVVSSDGSTIYVVFNDLRIIEIDVASRQITRENSTLLLAEPTVFGVELGSDGTLLVGVRDNMTSWTGMTLLPFALPSLDPLDPIPVQEFPRVASGPDGELYLWERSSTDVRRLNLDDGSMNVISLGGDKTLIADIVRSD